jgi:hypothetical protein
MAAAPFDTKVCVTVADTDLPPARPPLSRRRKKLGGVGSKTLEEFEE